MSKESMGIQRKASELCHLRDAMIHDMGDGYIGDNIIPAWKFGGGLHGLRCTACTAKVGVEEKRADIAEWIKSHAVERNGNGFCREQENGN